MKIYTSSNFNNLSLSRARTHTHTHNSHFTHTVGGGTMSLIVSQFAIKMQNFNLVILLSYTHFNHLFSSNDKSVFINYITQMIFLICLTNLFYADFIPLCDVIF